MTIIGGQDNFAHLADHTPWPAAIFTALAVTLGVYLFVVAAGMSTVFTTDEQRRHERVKKAAILFYCQVFCVIVFAFLLTLAVFTYGSDPDRSTTAGEKAPASGCSELTSSETMTSSVKGRFGPGYGREPALRPVGGENTVLVLAARLDLAIQV